ncbi:MAG: lytic transglycosylase domain-containing protein [Candidatus Tectimicrobiota bacterium]
MTQQFLCALVLLGGVLWGLLTPVSGALQESLYDQVISTASYEHGLDPALIKAVIKCESGFNPRAQSHRGAQGLMQLMPGTQSMLGVSQPFDPQDNISAGTRYLAMLKQTFGGNLQLALAAYNAGPQTVVAAGYAVPGIAETQQYVRCVWAAYERYRQPGAPSFALAPRPSAPPPTLTPRLVVSPLRLSSQVAQIGQRLTVQLEAVNASKQRSHGVVMLNYPEHLVSFMALHSTGQETMVQLPSTSSGAPGPAAPGVAAYQLLWSHWPAWAPGERRTAVIALVPRVPQDITMHLSVILHAAPSTAASQRWSSVVRIPFQAAALLGHDLTRTSLPRR